MTLTVACVLRSGGVYDARWVDRLAAGVRRHLAERHRFVCLTDMPVSSDVDSIALSSNAPPGWWSKLELFAPGVLRGRALYFDLDTVIVGDIAPLAAYRGSFAMLSDFYSPVSAQSGVMAWNADGLWPIAIRTAFAAGDLAHIGRLYGGDGPFIARQLNRSEDRLDRLFPDRIVSYKRDCRGGVPAGAAVVCFHGTPKPHELSEEHPLAIAWRQQ